MVTISRRGAQPLMTAWLLLFLVCTVFLSQLWQGIHAFISLGLASLLWAQSLVPTLPTPSSLPLQPGAKQEPKHTVPTRQVTLQLFVVGLAMMIFWWVENHLDLRDDPALILRSEMVQHLVAAAGALVLASVMTTIVLGLRSLLVEFLRYWDLTDAPPSQPAESPPAPSSPNGQASQALSLRPPRSAATAIAPPPQHKEPDDE